MSAAGLGEGCVSGHTQALVVEQRERLRAAVLTRALETHPDRGARPIFAFPQFDKLSQAWILATTSPATYLPAQIFRERMAAQFCLPSPVCEGKVGQTVGANGAVVDRFGDSVLCATLPFDTWRHKHDDAKLSLVERAHHAHIQCDAEIFGLFRDLVPAATRRRDGACKSTQWQNP